MKIILEALEMLSNNNLHKSSFFKIALNEQSLCYVFLSFCTVRTVPFEIWISSPVDRERRWLSEEEKMLMRKPRWTVGWDEALNLKRCLEYRTSRGHIIDELRISYMS